MPIACDKRPCDALVRLAKLEAFVECGEVLRKDWKVSFQEQPQVILALSAIGERLSPL